MNKRILMIALSALFALATAACTGAEQRTAGYGIGGAALGALTGAAITGRTRGALAGAAIGGVAGTLIGATTSPRDDDIPYCRYRDPYGRIYVAPC